MSIRTLKIIAYAILSVTNFAMYIIWLTRPTVDYLEKHQFCAVASFDIAVANLIMAVFFAF